MGFFVFKCLGFSIEDNHGYFCPKEFEPINISLAKEKLHISHY
jgi:hypothetical protein